ncbi:unnamed protein product, partial [Hymenolepis diminuta]
SSSRFLLFLLFVFLLCLLIGAQEEEPEITEVPVPKEAELEINNTMLKVLPKGGNGSQFPNVSILEVLSCLVLLSAQ